MWKSRLVRRVLVIITSTRVADVVELRDDGSEEREGSTSCKHSFTDDFAAGRVVDVPHLPVLGVVRVSDGCSQQTYLSNQEEHPVQEMMGSESIHEAL